MQNMCETVLNGNTALLVDLSAAVSVRCLTVLGRDSTFECRPCVQTTVCLLKMKERKTWGGRGGCAAISNEGKGVKLSFFLFFPFLFLLLVSFLLLASVPIAAAPLSFLTLTAVGVGN